MLKQDIKILTAEDIRQVIDRAEQVLEIPEWGGAVKLRAWNLEERDRVLALSTDNGRLDGKTDPSKLIRMCIIYGVVEPKLDEECINSHSWVIMDRIATEVMKLNSLVKGADLTTSVTFRPESGPAVPVPAGEGPGPDGAAPAG